MKRTIKIIGFGAMSLFLMLLSFSSYSQSCAGNNVTVSLQNFTQTTTEVEFDVYIQNTGTTSLSLAALAGGINLNAGFIPGTATFTCISQPSANAFTGFAPLTTAPVFTVGPFANHIRWTESPVAFAAAVNMPAATDMKFGRFRITSSVAWTTNFPGTLDILNMTSGPLTKINAVVYCSTNTNSTALNSAAPGTMSVGATSNYILNPMATGPTASVLAGDATICAGSSSDLTVTITGGASPYDVVYNDGTSDVTVSGYVSGAAIPVSPTATTTYTLVSVTDAGANAGTGNSGTATVMVNNAATGTDVIADCNPITWIDGMMYSASNNTAMFTIVGGAANGCDSTVTLDFTLNSASTGTDVISDCNPITWIDGLIYTATNNTSMFTIVGGAANGCDSIVTIDFTLLSASTGTDVIADCNPITWIDGMMYSASNNTAMFTIAGGAANGCDSIVTLDFTLNSASAGTDVISDCNPITWIDGMMYSASNNTAMFTIVGGAANGCDSVVTLDFTLNSGSTGTDVIASCDPITWIDGMMYSASNNTAMFTIVGGAANGCDSIVTLDFTLNTVGTAANVAATNITSFTADVTWDLISAFDITVQYRELGTLPWTTITGISSAMTMQSLSGLTANTTYEVEVIANCSATSAGTPSTGFFTTNAAGCSTPMALTVSDNTGSTITMTWTPVPMASWYAFRYKESTSVTWISGGSIGGAGSTKFFSGLTANTSYDFEGRSYCPDGSAGPWSPTLVVTTNALSGCALAPVLTASTVSGSNATITWASVSGAGWYQFRYKPQSSATFIGGGSAGSAATSKTYTGLMVGTAYDFEGRTICANGIPSAWGAIVFTTTPLVGCELPPVLDLTAAATSMSSITISWPAVAGAAWYSFQYKESSSTIWLNGGSASGASTMKTRTGLLPGTSYDFQARTHCSTGIASAWSTTGTYMTDGGPSTLVVDASNDKVTNLEDKSLSAQARATSVYPNPATDKVNVEIFMETSSDNTAVRLLDMSGRLVREVSAQTEAGVNTIAVDMRDIADGMYTVMVYQNGSLLHTAKVKKK